jgi:hypothetical protein
MTATSGDGTALSPSPVGLTRRRLPVHWRQVTAIRAADTDGARRPGPELELVPHDSCASRLSECPRGHRRRSRAGARVLDWSTYTCLVHGGHHAGRRTGRFPEYRRGTRWSTLSQDNVDARVWAGGPLPVLRRGRRLDGTPGRRLRPAAPRAATSMTETLPMRDVLCRCRRRRRRDRSATRNWSDRDLAGTRGVAPPDAQTTSHDRETAP